MSKIVPLWPGKQTNDTKMVDIDIFADLGNGTEDANLIKRLQREHPERQRMLSTWKRNADFAMDRIDTDEDKTEYLVQGLAELDDEWAKRVELSAFTPETPELLNNFVGSVFSIPATRDVVEGGPDEKRAKAFIDAAGPEHQPLEEVSKKAARLALVFNEVDGFLDRPADEPTELPHITLYTPEHRLDWDRDRKGNYTWVKYKETLRELDGWSGEEVMVDEYRIIDTKEIQLYRVIRVKNKAKRIEFSRVSHNFKSHPVVTWYWDRDGDAWVAPLVESDVATFRQQSDHGWDMFQVAHSTLVAHIDVDKENPNSNAAADRMSRGVTKMITLDRGDGDSNPESIEYLEPPIADLEHQWEVIKDGREHTRDLAGSGVKAQSTGGAAESGIAIKLKQEQKSKNFRNLAQSGGEWEWKVLELVVTEPGAARELKRDEIINLRYPTDFDQRSIEDLRLDLDAAIATGSETLVREVKKSLASKLVGSGTTQEVIATIHQEVEAAEAIPEPEEDDDAPFTPRT